MLQETLAAAWLAREAAARPRTALPAARAGAMRLRWAVSVTAAALLLGGFGFGLGAWRTPSGVAGPSFVGVGFLPARGWTVVQSGTFAQTGAPTVIAANVPVDPQDDVDAPYATLESLPPGGVLISARFGVRGDASVDAGFPARVLPLRIAAAEALSPELDPLPVARRLAQYRLRAGVGPYDLDARIYFGTPFPSAALLSAAQSALDKLVVSAERVTLFARPTVLERNQLTTLLGSVESRKADEIVTIEAKACGQTSFRGIFATRTGEGGGWTLQTAPTITTTLRADWNGAKSTTVTIQTRAWVQLSSRPRSAKGFGFEVAVRSPLQFWKRQVLVQRLDRRLGRWIDVKKVILTETGAPPGSTFVWSSGKFSLAVPKRTTVRAVFPLSQARPCYLTGYSNQLQT